MVRCPRLQSPVGPRSLRRPLADDLGKQRTASRRMALHGVHPVAWPTRRSNRWPAPLEKNGNGNGDGTHHPLAVPPSPLDRSNHPAGWAALTEGLVGAQPPPSSVASQHPTHGDHSRSWNKAYRLLARGAAPSPVQMAREKRTPTPPRRDQRTGSQRLRDRLFGQGTRDAPRKPHGRSSCQRTPKRSQDREPDKVTEVAEIVTGP